MGDTPHQYAFSLAVVGDPGVMFPADLHRLLDLLVNRHLGQRRVVLLGFGGSPGADWARENGYTQILCGGYRNRTKDVCHLVAMADAVVVLGEPGPWSKLVSLCRDAGVPVRVYRTRPRLPPPTPPAWDV